MKRAAEKKLTRQEISTVKQKKTEVEQEAAVESRKIDSEIAELEKRKKK